MLLCFYSPPFSEHIYKITKRLGPHLGPILGVAAAGGMGIVGVRIVQSPMSPFPVPHLPLPPVGKNPVKQVIHYPGHFDIVPKGKAEGLIDIKAGCSTSSCIL